MTTQSAAVLDTPPMGTTMRALVKESAAPGAAIREVPVPQPGPGEMLVRVHAASVCGTDVHIERWDQVGAAELRPAADDLRPRDGRRRGGARPGR